MFRIIISAVLLLSLLACAPAGQETEVTNKKAIQLGEVSFPVKGDKEAAAFFERGLLLLHSFEYEDARAAFLKAQEIDANLVMAYWGEAMTYNHSLWQRQDKEKALAALNKLADNPEERAKLLGTDIEKDFFAAIEVLLGEGTKKERDIAYEKFMEGLTKKYPNNQEVAAFYAISLLGASRNGRDEVLYGKSANIVKGIIEENPNHPGALHYLIHSYDDPAHAHLAKNAADSYSKVAPDAAHALHMPSHIYVALGDWDNVVTSNIASWNASVKRMERKELDNNARSYHAFNWLQYGLLQRGELEKATGILEDMVQYTKEESSKKARGYLIAMKGAHLVETNNWEGAIADIAVDASDLNLVKKTNYDFIEGMKAYTQKDKTQLKSIIKNSKKRRLKAMNVLSAEGPPMCSAGGFANKPPNQLDVDMAHIMEMELQAYLATLSNDQESANEWFEKAIKLEETLNYSYGPPTILKPIHEAYGEWLLDQQQAEKALTIFEKALERQPRRLRSLQGKMEVAEMLEKQAVLMDVQEELSKSTISKERQAIL